jgi:hypothetical protein
MWHDGIVKLALETIDYGEKLGKVARLDYRIATFTKDGVMDNIPVRYDSKFKARNRLKELAKQIKCEIGEDVFTESEPDIRKEQLLRTRAATANKKKLYTAQFFKGKRC